jgi:hypothetical protein
MMSRLARQRTVAVSMQAHIRKHTNRRIDTCEACLSAHGPDFGVRNVACGSVK